jgi:hypothetical protein
VLVIDSRSVRSRYAGNTTPGSIGLIAAAEIDSTILAALAKHRPRQGFDSPALHIGLPSHQQSWKAGNNNTFAGTDAEAVIIAVDWAPALARLKFVDPLSCNTVGERSGHGPRRLGRQLVELN